MSPTAVPAETVLEMATICGARALGIQDEIGSLDGGKKADFVAIDMRAVHLQPWHNPVGAVVYGATGRGVELVIVDGREVVRVGKLDGLGEEAIWMEAKGRAKRVVEREGLKEQVGARWPVS